MEASSPVLDVRFNTDAGVTARQKAVSRRCRTVLLLGLDGAGKTRLATALSDPTSLEAATALTVPTDLELEIQDAAATGGGLSRPYIVRDVDDRLLVKSTTFSLGKLPPTQAISLLDASGCASHRAIWPDLLRRCDTESSGEPQRPDAVLYVISAHDPWRTPLAWAEMLRVAMPPPEMRLQPIPLLVLIARTRSTGCCMSPADVLKAVEDMIPIRRSVEHPWTVLGVDLRAREDGSPSTGGCLYSLADLRAVSSWILQQP